MTIDSWRNISSGLVALLNECKQFFYLYIKDIDATLVFPEFDFEYIGNAPAMKCNTVTHGAGYKYRLAIESRGIDFVAYDESFFKAMVEEKDNVVIDIVLNRLRNPFALKEGMKLEYINYLKENINKVISYCSQNDDLPSLEILKTNSVFTEGNINSAVEESAKTGNSQIAAFVLDIKLSAFKGSEKRFDL